MKKASVVIFIDGRGVSHEALVTACKQRIEYTDARKNKQVNFNEVAGGGRDCVVSGVYVDRASRQQDPTLKFFDVPHYSDPSRQDNNPGVPSYQLNCWKEVDEEHTEIPSDHPNFDHPFHREYEVDGEGNFRVDDAGNKILNKRARPGFEGQLAAHQEKPETQAQIAAAEASNTYGPVSEEFKNAVEFLKLRGLVDPKAAAERAKPEEIKLMSDAHKDYKAALAGDSEARRSAGFEDQSNVSDEAFELRRKNAQLEAAVDQGSDALFEKDQKIGELQAEIEKLKAIANEPEKDGVPASEPGVIAQLDTDTRIADSSSSASDQPDSAGDAQQ
jgi:hypothetical protein